MRWLSFNHISVLADCGGTLTDSVGSFSSPDSDGDGNYDANVRCEWNIEAAENKYIMLEINSIDIEDAYCIYDYILVGRLKMRRAMRMRVFRLMRTAKVQISLRIR